MIQKVWVDTVIRLNKYWHKMCYDYHYFVVWWYVYSLKKKTISI